MSGKTNTTFTPEEISQAAQENVKYLCLVMVDYLMQHGQRLDEFWGFVGQRFAPSWKRGASARQVALGAALNMVSADCQLRAVSGDESRADAVLASWPSEDALAYFGLTQEQADSIWGLFGPIAESLGYAYEWHRQGDEVTMTFSR